MFCSGGRGGGLHIIVSQVRGLALFSREYKAELIVHSVGLVKVMFSGSSIIFLELWY